MLGGARRAARSATSAARLSGAGVGGTGSCGSTGSGRRGVLELFGRGENDSMAVTRAKRKASAANLCVSAGSPRSASVASSEAVSGTQDAAATRDPPDEEERVYDPATPSGGARTRRKHQKPLAAANVAPSVEVAEDVLRKHAIPDPHAIERQQALLLRRERLFKSKMAEIISKFNGPPATWEKELELIKEIRAGRTAPVDAMGAEACAIDDEEKAFHTLIALMLSSQTRDQSVFAAMQKLKEHGLTVDNVANTDQATLTKLIRNVGFRNQKATFIKLAAEKLRDEYDGKVPRKVDEIMSFKGVGPKMAYLVLNIAFNDTTQGIGVDTHMHRIFNVLGWAESRSPEETRIQLEHWLPKEHWATINLLVVGLGQMVQQPKRSQTFEHLSTMSAERQEEALTFLRRIGLKDKSSRSVKSEEKSSQDKESM
ncbi:Endonuclease III-like [Hondaea fermentalgiana]|uniref:DNA-(apurinic or apyrimidinic site) lyase n=1 Tax=Hondaea fermentalgiana TaxID=2315210 RepID=A0A2R5G0U1_9STRA|nr:Endonuclease III-like [Hondaea fermentalgiana]|eukprot:GBG24637.1 Endonuclease III-like [Hondaea fermentalgiana]